MPSGPHRLFVANRRPGLSLSVRYGLTPSTWAVHRSASSVLSVLEGSSLRRFPGARLHTILPKGMRPMTEEDSKRISDEIERENEKNSKNRKKRKPRQLDTLSSGRSVRCAPPPPI